MAPTYDVHVCIETPVPHLLRAYDRECLVDPIRSKRTEIGVPAYR